MKHFGINYAKDAGLITAMKNRQRKPLVFISGPYSVYTSFLSKYTERGEAAKEANTHKAIYIANDVLRQGGIPFVPHLTHFWDKKTPKDWQDWIIYDSYWLSVCDCVVRIDGESRGADAECALAQEMGILIITEEEVVNGFDFSCVLKKDAV